MDRKKNTRRFLWSLIVALFIVNLLLTIITFAQCTPVTFLWDRTNPNITYHGTCWDHRVQQYYGYFQGGSLPGAVCNLPMLMSCSILIFQRSPFGPLSYHIHLESTGETKP